MILIDINVLLDIVQRREPRYRASVGCTAIVTRNVRDFRGSPVSAVTPEEYLLELGRGGFDIQPAHCG